MVAQAGDLVLDYFGASVFCAAVCDVDKLILVERINGNVFLLPKL